jgi:glucose/arabinose dehydrogenase
VAAGAALTLCLSLGACGGPAPEGPAEPAAQTATPSPTPIALPPQTVTVTVPSGLAEAPFDVARRLTVPAGWTASLYARVEAARFLATTPDGRMLVSQPKTGRVLLVERGSDGVGLVTQFIGGLDHPHDMVFAELSGRTWLFIAEADQVVRYPYSAEDKKAQSGQVVVSGLPSNSTSELRGNYAHQLKNIAVKGDTLYVSIASTCNACLSDTKSDPQRGAIYRYDAEGRNAGRRLYARGIRNAEGLAFVPGTDELWAVVNNRDNILVPDDRDVDGDGSNDRGTHMTSYVDKYPPEEFIRVVDGGFYGWPFCNPNPDNGLRNMPFDRDYEFNRDGRAADCSTANRVDVGIAAHTAPLGLTFTQDTPAPDLGAVVALHGSWNSSVPVGYKVIHFPWTPNGPGEEQDLATGFLDETSGEIWARPVDVAVDTDGSLIVSDDKSGSLIRLTPP